ncbi:MAG TPA: beta-ketoacyl synthase chain length factor [Flavitalea sp.]|nr:beta-ketoacyl synthase chain length factor [Flavitalea sp.]
MKTYLRAMGNVSPQPTYGRREIPLTVISPTGNRMMAIEPDYKELIDAKMLRRMSRIIRMGVAAAMECLQEAALQTPDAIITGTAYGCLQDTDLFLTRMVDQKEELLTPTAFIQSTHNTVGAQISLIIQCRKYNNCFVHRGFSFESALLDAMLFLEEEEGETVLAGAVDEITDRSHVILSRMGLYKPQDFSGELIGSTTRGTVAGEGAAFFLLGRKSSVQDYCTIDGLKTFYKPSSVVVAGNEVSAFLDELNIGVADLDLIITGKNGDASHDSHLDEVVKDVLPGLPSLTYKDLCGEYPSSTAFALWMVASILRQGRVPATKNSVAIQGVRRILIYNNYLGIHHTLMLVTAC